MPSGSVHEKVPLRTNPRRDFCLESMEALPSLNHLMRLGRSLLNRDGLAVHHLPRREKTFASLVTSPEMESETYTMPSFVIATLQHDRMVSAPQAVAVAVVPRSRIAPAGVSTPFDIPYLNRLATRQAALQSRNRAERHVYGAQGSFPQRSSSCLPAMTDCGGPRSR